MRIVLHKKQEHTVYEGTLEFESLTNISATVIKHSFADTNVNDWVMSENGFIVQCIDKRSLYEYPSYKTKDGTRKYRPTKRHRTKFLFPRMAVCILDSKLNTKPFYFPTSGNTFTANDGRFLGKLTSKPKVRIFCEAIVKGYTPEYAYMFAFKQPILLRKILFLLSHSEVIDYIFQKNSERIKNMKQELEALGMNTNELAKLVVEIAKDKKENSVIRKWALEFTAEALKPKVVDNEQTNNEATLAEASRLIAINNN